MAVPTFGPMEYFARDRRFWLPVACAVPIGLAAGLVGYGFTWLVGKATAGLWGGHTDNDFLGGSLWWIALTVGGGVAVGLLRRRLRIPPEPAGALENITERHVDQASAAPMILVSFLSLSCGASLGPFDAGTRGGGAIGGWLSDRLGVDEELKRINTLSGINGGIGGLLTSPVLATLFVTELNPPRNGEDHYRTLAPNLVASLFGFFVVFGFAGATFLDVFAVPGFEVELWHFGAAVLLGLVGAFLARLLGATVFVVKRLATRIAFPVVRSAIGGLALGVLAVALPLTLGSGKAQLPEMIEQADALGGWLLVAVVGGKTLAMAISLSTGFIGGPVMPTLFIGGAAGVAAHVIVPGLPPALALSCLLVAVPGASIKAPFSMALLAVLTVGVGPIEAAPAAVAVLTAYLATTGLGLFAGILPGKTANPADPANVSYRDELFDLEYRRTEP